MSLFDKSVVIRGPFNFDPDLNSVSSATVNDELSLTLQSEYEETDINYIVRQYGVTGTLPNGNLRFPSYGDFTNQVTDYQSALNLLIDADQSFMDLPAELRKRFDNSPAKLLDFLNNADNLDEARDLGLIPKPSPASSEGTSEETDAEGKA